MQQGTVVAAQRSSQNGDEPGSGGIGTWGRRKSFDIDTDLVSTSGELEDAIGEGERLNEEVERHWAEEQRTIPKSL